MEPASEATVPMLRTPPPLPGMAGVVSTSDHAVIGRLYIAISMVFLVGSTVLWALAGAEAVDLGGFDILEADVWTQVVTLAELGFFVLGVWPLLIGLAMFVVPLQLGSPSVAFPRLAAASFWGWLVGAGILIAGYIADGGPNGDDVDAVLLTVSALGLVVLSLLAATVSIMTTVLAVRPAGMSLRRVPAFSWSMLTAGSLWVLTFPVLLGNLLLIYLDADHGQELFGAKGNIWAQVDWVFSQPAVFVFLIPVLGITVDVTQAMARAPQALHRVVIGAIGVFAAFSFGAWAQTAFNAALVERATWIAMSFVLALPLLALGGTLADNLRRGRPMFGSPLALGLLAFVAALAAAVCAALAAVDPLNLIGTTWTAGLAKLVGVAAVLGAVAGLQYWGARIWGRSPSEGLMLLAFLLLAAGGAAFAVPELVAGGLGQVPLDIVGEVEVVEDPFEALNGVMAAGAAALGLGVVLTVLAIVPAAMRGGRKPAEARWRGPTLEWAAVGVPAIAGSRAPVAEVRSATPLLDDAEPATTDAATGELN